MGIIELLMEKFDDKIKEDSQKMADYYKSVIEEAERKRQELGWNKERYGCEKYHSFIYDKVGKTSYKELGHCFNSAFKYFYNRNGQSLVKVAKAINKSSFDTSCINKYYLDKGDGGYYEGWISNTKGEKVYITVRYAGGYNIQCLHLRAKIVKIETNN